jgi:hypothetical protein
MSWEAVHMDRKVATISGTLSMIPLAPHGEPSLRLLQCEWSSFQLERVFPSQCHTRPGYDMVPERTSVWVVRPRVTCSRLPLLQNRLLQRVTQTACLMQR